MTVNLSLLAGAGAQFFNDAGVPLSGGKINTYTAGTTTPATTYTTSAGNIAHTNPIILDSAGRVPSGEIWLTDGANYKFTLTDQNDVLIATWDNISGNGSGIASQVSAQIFNTLAASSGSSLIGYDAGPACAVPRTVESKLSDFVSINDFGAVGDGVTDDTGAVVCFFNSAIESHINFFPISKYSNFIF